MLSFLKRTLRLAWGAIRVLHVYEFLRDHFDDLM